MLKNKMGMMMLLIFILILSACGNEDTEVEGSNNPDSGSGSGLIEGLPDKMVWSVYDVGSGGYTEATAIANEITKKYGTQIRLLPSSSGVGRMQPMKSGAADVGRLGDEYQFAFEGIDDFATEKWGPQDVRVVWPPLSFLGFVGLEKSGIETIADLKGKKVPFIIGNSSVNIKLEATLAFADLTWDDVQKVELSDYGGQAEALKNGQVDIIFINPTASVLIELETMEKIKWLEMEESDTEGWARAQEIAPWMQPYMMDNGAGMTKENPVTIIGYAYPVVAYADQSKESMYAYVKSMDETYDSWENAAANLHNWHKDSILIQPAGVPLHDGMIQFLEEEGLWTEEYQTKNDELVERSKKLKEAWNETVSKAKEEKISEKDFPKYWMSMKKELIK
ncbi:TAXI family TRAP transporter solute-binding subunit [Sporosarcina sp. P13]|uniref:TAXI family TRAP transporter solute-binding subunit n=1 Tax=Sporosarcina sp. P13 TaxID=2048263 RepID=UPI001303F9A3|nr:TAXI family TRAP transporter solute-binding subunit [Sporosarcina sp. P13]